MLNADIVLTSIGSTEPSTFREFLSELDDHGVKPETKPEYAELFTLLRDLELEDLVEVDRNNQGRIDSLVLTEAGAARVKEIQKR